MIREKIVEKEMKVASFWDILACNIRVLKHQRNKAFDVLLFNSASVKENLHLYNLSSRKEKELGFYTFTFGIYHSGDYFIEMDNLRANSR